MIFSTTAPFRPGRTCAAKGEQDVAVRHLSNAERALIRELNIIRIRRVVKGARDEDNEDPREVLKRDLLDDIARLRKSLDAIAVGLTSEGASPQDSSAA